MGSVQQCFSWELVVAASIIWHRLQRGVTFVLQDGWLCMAWTLLTLSHWWASRRGYKRHTFPQATGAKMRRKSTGLLQCDSTFQFIYLIKLCVRYWNIYSEKTLLQKKKKKKNPILRILSLLRLQLRSCSLLRQMKNVPPPLFKGGDILPSQIPTVPSPFWCPCLI